MEICELYKDIQKYKVSYEKHLHIEFVHSFFPISWSVNVIHIHQKHLTLDF